jgi:CRP-like cAMP-binding protein
MDDARFQIMRRSIGRWVEMPDARWAELAACFRPVERGPAQHLVLPGAPMRELYFVARGLLRLYYLDAEGRMWNKSFVQEGRFAGAFSSYLLGLPAPFGIEALEPSAVLAARWADFETLCDRHPIFERLGRKFAEWLLVQKELRERAFLELDATARYQAFLRDQADLAERVSSRHVASYLGVTEVTLSRIRGKLARAGR